MKKNKAPGLLRPLMITAGALGYFGTAVYALIKDSAALGCAFIIGTFAAVAVLVIAGNIKERGESKRLLRYGQEPLPLTEALSLPEQPERRLAALRILAGDDAESLMKNTSDDDGLFSAMSGGGRLLRLEKDFTARRLSEGINSLLDRAGLSERTPHIIETDILAAENGFARTRHEDGIGAQMSDLNAAAYLLRKTGTEPVVLFRRRPAVTADGETPEHICVALVPAEEMYSLCRLCDIYAREEAAE